MRVVAIIPAAGEGRRMNKDVEKQFLHLRGIPLLVHTLTVFDESPEVDGVVVVIGAQQRQALEKYVLGPHPCKKLLRIVDGGPERQDSVANGLRTVPRECELVVIHDGVRPLLSRKLLSSVLETADRYGAAIAAIPACDSVKQAEAGVVRVSLDRESIWLAQTPQIFRANLLRQAYERAARDGITLTDDAGLVERAGF